MDEISDLLDMTTVIKGYQDFFEKQDMARTAALLGKVAHELFVAGTIAQAELALKNAEVQ